MATGSLVINSTTAQGKSLSKSITFINPDANSATLQELAQKLNALTTNTYKDSYIIDKVNADTEERRDALINPNLHLDGDGKVQWDGNGVCVQRTSMSAMGMNIPKGYTATTAFYYLESDGAYGKDWLVNENG